MTLCEDDAKLVGPVSLFIGVETQTPGKEWALRQFVDAANFAKQHNISTLFIKVSEVGSRAGDIWYGGIDKWDSIYKAIQNIINVVPYAFIYGDADIQKEIDIAVQFLNKYQKYCLDIEGSAWSTPDNASRAKRIADTLASTQGKLFLSCPANPVESSQLPFIQALSPAVNVYMPMAYNNYLNNKWQNDFAQIGDVCIQPTLDLSDEFGTNDPVNIAQSMKDRGILAISLWEYGFAQQNTALLDRIVKVYIGDTTVVSKPWFMYDIVVPFGDPHFDTGLGGSHDMDVAPPPNCPVTALLPGIVVDLSAPSWGKQVGIQLDSPVQGIPYMGYLHLSAINPSIKMGQHVNVGDLLGWAGGGTSDAMYQGTKNPTGQNFLNDPFMSSQIQVGIALMRGPQYGGPGWENWPTNPNIEHFLSPLNPTPVLSTARKAYIMSQAPSTQDQALQDEWNCFFAPLQTMLPGINPPPPYNTAIAAAWRSMVKAGKRPGPPLTWEAPTWDWSNNKIIAQQFAFMRCEFNNGVARWFNSQGEVK